MAPVLRNRPPAGRILRQHRKSKCVVCSLQGGCTPVPLTPQQLKIRKLERHRISHATDAQMAEREKKGW